MKLKVDNVSASYGNIRVLWGVSLDVSDREIVSMIGANGAGKSTLLKSVMGIVRPTDGNISFDGKHLVGLRPHSIVHIGIGYVPEGRRLFPEMNVKENIRMGAPRAAKNLDSLFERIYTLFPVLEDRKNQQASTLSGGEQQMVAISRAMMSDPKLLLLDELSFGLSPIMFEKVLGAIESIRDTGVSVLMAEQNSERALEVSDRTFVIENGRIEISGPSGELIDNSRVRAAYLGIGE